MPNEFINLLVYRGNDTSIALNFKNNHDDPIDITGWTITFTAKNRKFHVEEEHLIQIIVTTHLDALNGKTGIFVPRILTENLAGIYYYQIDFKTNEDYVRTFATGNLQIADDQ